jgi:hypothetical protein
MAQIFTKVLHLLQEFFAFVQREFTLAVSAIQQLVLSTLPWKEIENIKRPFHQGALLSFFPVLFF